VRNAQTLRSKPLADKIMLIAVVLCLAIALVRVGLVVVTVPYAMYKNSVAVPAAGGASSKSVGSRVAHSWTWLTWWGGRPNPHRDGGNYLGVMSRHITSRNLGCVIGVLLEKDNAKGYGITRVIVPSDMTALYGEESGNLMKRADGTEFRTYWAPISRDAAIFSDVPVKTRKYDPVLTAAQSAALRTTAGLKEQSKEFWVAKPRVGGSGQWILYASVTGEKRDYFFIPLELSPAGGAK